MNLARSNQLYTVTLSSSKAEIGRVATELVEQVINPIANNTADLQEIVWQAYRYGQTKRVDPAVIYWVLDRWAMAVNIAAEQLRDAWQFILHNRARTDLEVSSLQVAGGPMPASENPGIVQQTTDAPTATGFKMPEVSQSDQVYSQIAKMGSHLAIVWNECLTRRNSANGEIDSYVAYKECNVGNRNVDLVFDYDHTKVALTKVQQQLSALIVKTRYFPTPDDVELLIRGGGIVLRIRRSNAQDIYLQDYQPLGKGDYTKPPMFWLGIDEFLQQVVTPIENTIIGGSTADRIAFAHTQIQCLLRQARPGTLDISVIDLSGNGRGIEFAKYRKQGVKHVTEIPKIQKFFEIALPKFTDKIFETLSMNGVTSVGELNHNYSLNESSSFVRWQIIWIQDVDLLARKYPGDFRSQIIDAIAQSEGAGIFWILSSDRPDRNVIPLELRQRITGRVCFRCNSSGDYQIILGPADGQRPKLRGNGEGIVQIDGREVWFQMFRV
jgi:hypothetical protein